MKGRTKIANLLDEIRVCIRRGEYFDTYHSSERRKERGIDIQTALYVLNTGWHEKMKDRFDENHMSWNYSVRGHICDSRELRVIVSFEEKMLLIVTAIELSG